MKGRRCGVFQEADEGDRLNVGLMKEMTGGDLILCRDLFKGSADMIQFKPQMKMILTCNQLPDVPSNDDGTWRRLRVIDFISKFIDNPTKPNEFKIDIQMKQKIKQWAPAFISYLINVYLTQYKNKGPIKEPIEVMASTNQYKMENDTMTEFKEARLVASTDPTDAISHEALWDDYKAFIKNINDKQALPKRPEFMKFIAKAFDIKPKNNRFYGIKFIIINDDNNKPGDLDV
jgi:phage/plasmid-associated DNA primase